MGKGIIKKKAINKLLSILGFSSTAFVFAACYAPLPPEDYQEKEYADSVLTAIESLDSLITANASDDKVTDGLPHRVGASHSPGNSGNIGK